MSGYTDSSDFDTGAAAVPSGTIRIPLHLVTAAWLSALATLIIGIPTLYGNPLYTEEQVLLLLVVHYVAVLFPIMHITAAYRRKRDFFHPVFLAGVTFLVFQLLMNPLVISQFFVLASRKLDIQSGPLRTETILHSYLVLLAGWFAYTIGQKLPATRLRARQLFHRKDTRLFLLIALAFILIGVIGNIGIIGGVGNYLSKMSRPWERWSEYEEASIEGGTKWTIFMRFLPVGLVVLAYGLCLRYRMRPAAFYAVLLAASVANMFLSCASGGRGTMLSTAFYGVVLINHSFKRFTFKALAGTFVVLLALSYVLGQVRAAAYLKQTEVVYVDNTALVQFGTVYLSNYLGTLTIIAEVEKEGSLGGKTAFAGLTGLLGGPTPLTTEKEVWHRVTGRFLTENPRYGAPGELYWNFGWPGLLVGMLLLGALVKALANAYERSIDDVSVGGGLMAVYAAFTANFIMLANLDYLPPYFTFQSVPFYILFWAYQRRRT